MLFDAHLHLADEESPLDLKKVEDIIQDAEKSGVKYLISNSTNEKTINDNIKLLKQFPNVCIGIGLFPTEFKTEKDLKKIDFVKKAVSKLKRESLISRVVIGEIGLDFKDEGSNRDIQEKALIEQVNIAKENNLYVEIHSRFAIKQTILLLEKLNYKNAIMHWFLDSRKYINRATKQGYFITLGPKYLYDETLFENIKEVPKEQILFETDYPVTVSNELQKPSKIKDIFNKYCNDAGVSKGEMNKILDKSFKKLFPVYTKEKKINI